MESYLTTDIPSISLILIFMKINIKFECSLCGSQHQSIWSAWRCERKWIIKKSLYPIGLMFEYHSNDCFVGIFSIARVYEWDGWRNRHLLHTSFWACRNPDIWDSLGEETCGWEFVYNDIERFKKYNFVSDEYKKSPEFQRMVDFLKSSWISPSYYDERGVLQNHL